MIVFSLVGCAALRDAPDGADPRAPSVTPRAAA